MNDGMSVTARDLALRFSSLSTAPEQIPNVESATAISGTTALINAAKAPLRWRNTRFLKAFLS
jgi:hypothetical protein